jgi:hypothetical protein
MHKVGTGLIPSTSGKEKGEGEKKSFMELLSYSKMTEITRNNV